MSIPLDDLLPTSDSAYEPPADLRDLFTHGSPLFESADVHKFNRDGLVSPADFRDGFQAGVFDVLLKSGIGFFLHVHERNVSRLEQRALGFNRKVELQQWESMPDTWTISVHPHQS